MGPLTSNVKRKGIEESSFSSLKVRHWCGLDIVDWESTYISWNAIKNSTLAWKKNMEVFVYKICKEKEILNYSGMGVTVLQAIAPSNEPSQTLERWEKDP